MTVIRPNKKNRTARLAIRLGLVSILFLILNISVYSGTVDVKHEISEISKNVEQMRANNADLKNEFYSLTGQENLDRLAAERGLVKDKNPKWVFASQY